MGIAFDGDNRIRKYIGEHVAEFAKSERVYGSVLDAVVLVNLRYFHQRTKDDIPAVKALGEQPTDEDLLSFESRYGRQLKLVYGHFDPLLHLQPADGFNNR